MTINRLGLLTILLWLLSSCSSQREILYLQNLPENFSQSIASPPPLLIQPNDLLAIVVSSRDSELSQMFNLPIVEVQSGGLSTRVMGYMVGAQGQIDFPQLGIIEVGGLTREQLVERIKTQLIARGLVKDPVVSVEFLNFQVSVLGEVLRPGTFEVAGERATIFDALSRAGDMTIYGQRDRIKIIREVSGERTVAVVDLRGDQILDSPYYYLRQNDIIYVEPNKARSSQREINQNRTIGTYASVLSVILSVIALAI